MYLFADAEYRAVLRKLETLRLKQLSTIDFAEKVNGYMLKKERKESSNADRYYE
jgi:hypothetical protein